MDKLCCCGIVIDTCYNIITVADGFLRKSYNQDNNRYNQRNSRNNTVDCVVYRCISRFLETIFCRSMTQSVIVILAVFTSVFILFHLVLLVSLLS